MATTPPSPRKARAACQDSEALEAIQQRLDEIFRCVAKLVAQQPAKRLRRARPASGNAALQPAERFMSDWVHDVLPAPFGVCTNEQLYRAFLRWYLDAGLPHPPPLMVSFTKTALRWSQARVDPMLRYQQMALQYDDTPRKTARCWIPINATAPPGTTNGKWASAEVHSFELALGEYKPAPPPRGKKR